MPNKSQLYFVRQAATGMVQWCEEFGLNDAIFPDAGSAAGMAVVNNHPLITFPDNADRQVYFPSTTSQSYAGGSALVHLFWVAPSIIGDVRWYIAFERDEALGQIISVDSFGPEGSLLSPAPPIVDQIRKVTFMPNNAQMDGIQAGDPFRFRVRRDGGALGDNMAGDARLFRVVTEGI